MVPTDVHTNPFAYTVPTGEIWEISHLSLGWNGGISPYPNPTMPMISQLATFRPTSTPQADGRYGIGLYHLGEPFRGIGYNPDGSGTFPSQGGQTFQPGELVLQERWGVLARLAVGMTTDQSGNAVTAQLKVLGWRWPATCLMFVRHRGVN
jgi:hypothetical protein